MEELVDTMAELDVIKQLAEIMGSLNDDGRRRALWYLADIYGLSGRPQVQPPTQAKHSTSSPIPIGQVRTAP
jgi:hypothetical protein